MEVGKNKKQLISRKSWCRFMKPFHTPKSKQNPGHVFSPFVATEWSMDQLISPVL
jgi:hypothetical protein